MARSSDRPQADKTLATQREIQREQDQRDKEKKPEAKAEGKKPAVQAGAREQPQQLPAVHLQKPGHEADLPLRPRYEAPDYRGSGKLHGFAALITGQIPASAAPSPCCLRVRALTWPWPITHRTRTPRRPSA